MLVDGHLLRARSISPEANDLIRDILRFNPELRLSIPEISLRVLQLLSFFKKPRIRPTKSELWKMKSTYQPMLTRPDQIARRRKDLEHFRCMDRTLAFNDLSGRLPSPQPPLRRSRVFNSPQHPSGGIRLHCAPISGIPTPVAIPPEEPITAHKEWWHVDDLKAAGTSWYYS